jgi:opacity protein-like surface antigen
MASVKAILSAGAMLFGAIGGVQAADLLPPPPPPVEPANAPSFAGWYIRGDVGVGIEQFSDARSTFNPTNSFGNPPPPVTRVSTYIGDAAIAGVGVGYQFNNWLRFDGTAEYRTSAPYRSVNTYSGAQNFCFNSFCQDSYTASVSSGVFLANGYVDLGTWYGVTPFFGGGVGVAAHRFSGMTDLGAGSGYSPSSSSTNFAWALMAGAGFNITPNLKLEISYRYLDMGRVTSGAIACEQTTSCWFEKQSFKLSSNDVRIGFRYMFADYTPPPPPVQYQPPLVRKY